jgi:hypothetical protein
MSLCDQLTDQEVLEYILTEIGCYPRESLSTLLGSSPGAASTDSKIRTICGCGGISLCNLSSSPCTTSQGADYTPTASPGHCSSETDDPTQPGAPLGSGFDINYGSCIMVGNVSICSTAQYDPCKDVCASIKDPCMDHYGTALGLSNFPRRKMIGSCACNDPGDAVGHYNCANSGFPGGQTPAPPSPFTDNPTVLFDDIRLVKVFINNEEICIPILCDVGCDDFEPCNEQET